MIIRLRRQFIIIAMLSVTLVVFLTAVTINLFNYLSMDRTLSDILQMISENRGMIPQFSPGERPGHLPRGHAAGGKARTQNPLPAGPAETDPPGFDPRRPNAAQGPGAAV